MCKQDRIFGAITLGLLVLSLFAWWLISGPNPDVRARQFANALREENWGLIYDMSSAEERKRQRWDRSQFIQVMTEIAATTYKDVGEIKLSGDTVGQVSTKVFTFSFVATRLDGQEVKVSFSTTLYRGQEDWHPTIYNLPLHMHNLRQRPTRASLQRLVSACDGAGIDGFGRIDDHLEFSIDGVKEWLNGKAEWNNVYRNRPGY